MNKCMLARLLIKLFVCYFSFIFSLRLPLVHLENGRLVLIQLDRVLAPTKYCGLFPERFGNCSVHIRVSFLPGDGANCLF